MEGIDEVATHKSLKTPVVHLQLKVGRMGREQLQVVEWAANSIAWGLICAAWGAEVTLSITQSFPIVKLLRLMQPNCEIKTASRTLAAAKTRDYTGDLFVGTVIALEELKTVGRVIYYLEPRVVLIAIKHHSSRRQILESIQYVDLSQAYRCQLSTMSHEEVGGATTAKWKFLILVERKMDWKGPFLKKAQTCPQDIFTIIDDTIGGGWTVEAANSSIKGRTAARKAKHAHELGWDLSETPVADDCWVWAPTVFSKQPVLRRLAMHERLALWDFPQPKASILPSELSEMFLHTLIRGPPGKMLRKMVYEPLSFLWKQAFPEGTATASGIQPMIMSYKSAGVMEEETNARHLKAVKADNAQVDFSMWALPNETLKQAWAREVLRKYLHRWWNARLRREAFEWLNHSPDSLKIERKINLKAIWDCLRRANLSTYWEWKDGSRLFFWRWEHWWKTARDGEPFYHIKPPPNWMGRNPPAETWEYELKLREKEDKLVHRRYVEVGFVDCFVSRFGVAKGPLDIRLVWDAKRNGYNLTLWAPSFWLPTFKTLTDFIIKWLPCTLVDYIEGKVPTDPTPSDWQRCYQSDMDVGEMYLNYMLHFSERHSFGIKLEREVNGVATTTFKRFQRLMFGGKSSPYLAVQGHARGMELTMGNHADPKNPFQWARVLQNYPFSKTYDPSLPRVMKIRDDGNLASEAPTFIDDGRSTGSTKETAEAAAHALSCGTNKLGEQDAARKRRPVSLTPGAWTGKLLHCNKPHPRKAVLHEKWTQFREELMNLVEVAQGTSCEIDAEAFRSMTGRGMNQAEVYPDLKPYFKSFYNAQEAWRRGRDDQGWKCDRDEEFICNESGNDPPSTITITRELRRDAETLLQFYESPDPVTLPVRPKSKEDVVYIGGDAAAGGYGAGTQDWRGNVRVQYGIWSEWETSKGSNWREATNLARHFHADVKTGALDGKEVWLVTDNLVWSYILKKGMSSKKGLADLVKEIKLECRHREIFFHSLHVSGLRMIALGFDGLSRGDLDSGIMLGQDFRDLVPVDKTALELAGDVLMPWMRYWMQMPDLKALTPEGWFVEGHQPGIHLWAPPPAAALNVLEQIAQAKIKRPDKTCHVFICQRLMYFEEWRRRFEKEMDFWILIEPNPFWPFQCFEPLVLGIAFPLRNSSPWRIRRVPIVVDLGKSLQEMLKAGDMGAGNILREFWTCPWGFCGL